MELCAIEIAVPTQGRKRAIKELLLNTCPKVWCGQLKELAQNTKTKPQKNNKVKRLETST